MKWNIFHFFLHQTKVRVVQGEIKYKQKIITTPLKKDPLLFRITNKRMDGRKYYNVTSSSLRITQSEVEGRIRELPDVKCFARSIHGVFLSGMMFTKSWNVKLHRLLNSSKPLKFSFLYRGVIVGRKMSLRIYVEFHPGYTSKSF